MRPLAPGPFQRVANVVVDGWEIPLDIVERFGERVVHPQLLTSSDVSVDLLVGDAVAFGIFVEQISYKVFV